MLNQRGILMPVNGARDPADWRLRSTCPTLATVRPVGRYKEAHTECRIAGR